MKRRLPRPRLRLLLAAGSVVAVAAGVAVAPRGGPERPSLAAVVDLPPSGVRRIVVDAGGRQAELRRDPGGWSAGPGTPPQSAPLLFSAEDGLFPMLAYRVVDADPADPQYGLGEPAAVVHLEDDSGIQLGIRFGAATFSGGGFYAHRDSEPARIYLVPRSTVDLLRTLTTGERTASASPAPDRIGADNADRPETERQKELSTYLRQAVDAGGRMPPPAP